MKKQIITALAALTLCSCTPKEHFKVYAWVSGRASMEEEVLEDYFAKAAETGLDGILIECHGGYPEVLGDSTAFRDSAALVILRRAAVYAKKYDLELHAWMWTTNRTEMSLRNAHHDWYQVNGEGTNLADFKMYNREHYRFLCPNHEGVTEYLKDRVRELAEVEGLTGIHLDFIRYPDAILPYGLHESRGVVQDKVYPLWDCCYCDVCREKYKAQTGTDPLDLEDPTANEEWMQFRWDSMAKMASELCAEIKRCGKVSSAAVFASPEESKKLVRQDWVHFTDCDFVCPMIYHDSYAQPAEWVETASREGLEALKAAGNPAKLYSGFIVPRDGDFSKYFQYAKASGADGLCIFSLEPFRKHPEYWDAVKAEIEKIR